MPKPPLNYESANQEDDAKPSVRWQTVVSFSLLGMGLLCGLFALIWPHRRQELVAAAISLGITGIIIYFPFIRT